MFLKNVFVLHQLNGNVTTRWRLNTALYFYVPVCHVDKGNILVFIYRSYIYRYKMKDLIVVKLHRRFTKRMVDSNKDRTKPHSG